MHAERALQDAGAPTLVFLIDEGVDEVSDHAWEHRVAHVPRGLVIKLLCVCVDI